MRERLFIIEYVLAFCNQINVGNDTCCALVSQLVIRVIDFKQTLVYAQGRRPG